MPSFRQMTNDKVIKRADQEKIEYHNLRIETGFNAPGRTESDDEDDEVLYLYICGGGIIPALEVRTCDEVGVVIVDGHRRHKQIGRAIAAGKFLPDPKDGKFWIPIKQFEGNDIKRLARICTSNEGKKLTPLQLANVYARFVGFGLTATDIAKEINRSVSHVEQILLLSSGNHDVQRMVASGEVSASLAVQVQRSEGEGAGAVLQAALEKAKKQGKNKVTPSALKEWTPPAKYTAPMVKHVADLLKTIEPEVLARAGSIATFDQPDEPVTVTLSMRALYMLVQNAEVIAEAKESAEAKAREKANKAMQESLPAVSP